MCLNVDELHLCKWRSTTNLSLLPQSGNYLVKFEDLFDTTFWDIEEEIYFTKPRPTPWSTYDAKSTHYDVVAKPPLETPTHTIDTKDGI